MLGELVAAEIKQIDHEKECNCPACAVVGTGRAVHIYMAQSKCECPICAMTREMLTEQLERLNALFDSHMEMSETVKQPISDVLFIPESQESQSQAEFFMAQCGALMALARALQGSVDRFIALCNAAHEAYELVASSTRAETLRAKISVLTQQGIKHTEHTLNDLIEQNRDRDHNHNDVN